MRAIIEFSLIIKLAASAIASPFSNPSITSFEAPLKTRQTGEIGYLSYRTACTSGTACNDDYSFHWGEIGDFGGCNDVLGSWNSIYEPSNANGDTVETPLGDAKWVPADPYPDDSVEDGTFIGALEV